MTGQPLDDIRVVVFAGLGPVPYAAMLLADLGCAVTLIDRPQPALASMPPDSDPRRRGQRSIAIDLRSELGATVAARLVAQADVLIEGMRPGAADRLGFGPERCSALNQGLVYARITGWGQDGALATAAGHDINYIGLTGALGAMGSPGMPPPVPLNLLGDYAGGSAFAIIGILAALHERQRSGRGQVVDAAIVDGVASLSTATWGMRNAGLWGDRGQNAFDGSRPWYRTYETADDRFVAVGAIEPQFYAALLQGLGMDPEDWPRENAQDHDRLTTQLAAQFKAETRAHWERVFEGTDACVTPVLTLDEAPGHRHNRERGLFVGASGEELPAPAPRLGRTPARAASGPAAIGQHTHEVLEELGFDSSMIDQLREQGAVR